MYTTVCDIISLSHNQKSYCSLNKDASLRFLSVGVDCLAFVVELVNIIIIFLKNQCNKPTLLICSSPETDREETAHGYQPAQHAVVPPCPAHNHPVHAVTDIKKQYSLSTVLLELLLGMIQLHQNQPGPDTHHHLSYGSTVHKSYTLTLCWTHTPFHVQDSVLDIIRLILSYSSQSDPSILV